jgi:hypothetical protein
VGVDNSDTPLVEVRVAWSTVGSMGTVSQPGRRTAMPRGQPAVVAGGSLVVVVVLWRGREVGGRESAPAVLREEAR